MRALTFTPLLSSRCTSLSFSPPAFVSPVVALLCVCGKRVDGPRALSGDGRPRASPLLFGFDNNGRGSSAVTSHQRRWMAAIVGCKERNVGREEGEDGFLYFIFHCMRWFEGKWQATSV